MRRLIKWLRIPQPQKSEAFFASPVGCSDTFTLDLHSTR